MSLVENKKYLPLKGYLSIYLSIWNIVHLENDIPTVTSREVESLHFFICTNSKGYVFGKK